VVPPIFDGGVFFVFSSPLYQVLNNTQHPIGMSDAILDTLIISDLHLGSELSRAGEALDLLQSLRYARLILLGDIFSDLNFRRLTGEHWKFLSCIRKLSNPKRKVEVVWVEGNHDQGWPTSCRVIKLTLRQGLKIISRQRKSLRHNHLAPFPEPKREQLG
jgi:metallophosphoesterase superfamily enzyme